MDGAWPNAFSLEVDAWFWKSWFDFFFFLNNDDDLFFWKMNEAWLNTPSLTINVNFEKLYCTKAVIGAKSEQKGTKNAELIKIEGNGTVYQSA